MRAALLVCSAVVAIGSLAGCTGSPDEDEDTEPTSTEPPDNGTCRVLEPADIQEPVNLAAPVDCTEPHTAETFHVGTFTGQDADRELGDPQLGATVFEVCDKGFKKFTGADESLAMRTVLSWAWFGPSEAEWDAGARWYRCDVVGGTEASPELVELPDTAKGVLLGIPADRWLTCVNGATVDGALRVPCNEDHTWRAVSTIVVGEQEEGYPGDRVVEVKSRDACSDWVGAWMNYPVTDYEFAYTWFRRGDWDAGNRRSICWAKTTD